MRTFPRPFRVDVETNRRLARALDGRVQYLHARIRAIDRELALLHDERERAEAELAARRAEIRRLTEGGFYPLVIGERRVAEAPPAERPARTSLVEAIADVLADGTTLHRDEIARRLEVLGFDWGGRDAIRRVGTILGRNRGMFEEVERHRWRLRSAEGTRG